MAAEVLGESSIVIYGLAILRTFWSFNQIIKKTRTTKQNSRRFKSAEEASAYTWKVIKNIEAEGLIEPSGSRRYVFILCEAQPFIQATHLYF